MLIVTAFFVSALPAPPEAAAPVSFIRDVAPVLQTHCFACHNSRRKSGQYDMTRFDRLRAGGRSGDPLTPGEPSQGEFHALMVTTDERRMPPRDKGDAVPAAAAEVVRRWIAEGAKLDADIRPDADLVAELQARWVPAHPPASYPAAVPLTALTFAPDGHTLITNGIRELLVWNAATGQLVRRIPTRSERTQALAFLPGNRLVLAGGRPGLEGDVTLYDLNAATPGPGVRLVTAPDLILCLAVSADGRRLAAAGCDRRVRIWDFATPDAEPKPITTVEGHSDWISGVALTADGSRVATASRDKTAKVFDVATGEAGVTFPDHQNAVAAVALVSDGQTVVSAAGRTLMTWQPTGDGKRLKAAGGHADEVFRLVGHDPTQRLASASADKTVRLWNASTLAPATPPTLTGHSDQVLSVAFSPDGTRLAAGSHTGEVIVWQVSDGREVVRFHATPK